MELRPGYKQTEDGIIPEDWLEHTIGELIDFEGGSQPDKSYFQASRKRGYVRLIQIRDYKTDKYETYVPTHLARRFCTENDIMIGRYGPPVFQILRGIDGAYNVALIKAKPGPGINGSYAYYFLKQEKLFSFIEKLSQRSSGQTGVDLKELRQYALPLPPTKAEQEAIAEALSDTDALIESLEQLITKKRHLKQGAMQELLTGKKRLPGFSGDWDITTLSAISKEPMQNGVFYSPALKGVGVRLINVGDLYTSAPIDIDSLELFGATEKECERFQVEDGDLFFTRSSIVPSGIAHCNIYRALKHEPVVFDSHVIRMRPDTAKVDPSYLFRFCMSSVARHYLISHAKTATMTTIDQGVLGKCPVYFPSKVEQTAIATILSDMDAEIVSLEAKLTKTRQLKQGMMYNLLTGRIRLM